MFEKEMKYEKGDRSSGNDCAQCTYKNCQDRTSQRARNGYDCKNFRNKAWFETSIMPDLKQRGLSA